MYHPAIANKITGLFDKIAIDLSFGLTSSNGYNGFLAIVEMLSGYIYLVAIDGKDAETISKELWNYITLFGPPKEILSDQGNEFNNSIIKKLTEFTKIHHQVTSAYHPQTNGKVERYNYLIAEALRISMAREPNKMKWIDWLPFIQLAFNTKVHSRTGFTPYELMFGRKMNTFDDWSKLEMDDSESLVNRARELKQLYENKVPQSMETIAKKQEEQKKNQDKSHRVTKDQLKIGTQVLN